MGKYIQQLAEIITELDARESSGNCIYRHLQVKGWVELCDEGIDLFEKLKKPDEEEEFNQAECDWRYNAACTADANCAEDCNMKCPYKKSERE